MKNIKNFLSYAIGDLFVKGMLFISLPLLTRIMSPEQYGKLSILNTAILILYVFVSLNIQSVVINRVMKQKEGFSVFLSSCIYFLIPFQVLLIVLEPFYSSIISRLLGIAEKDVPSVLIICIMLSYIYIYTSYLQGVEQGGLYVKINVISKVCEILLIFGFALIVTTDQYLSKIYAQFLVCAPLLAFSFYKLKNNIVLKFSVNELKGALWFSVPLIVHVLSNSLLSQADRIIINSKLGSSSAGIYSFAYNLGMCILVLVMAWNSSWQPKLYQLINKNDSSTIQKVNNASSIIICAISATVMLFSKEVVIIMSTKEYYEGIELIPLIIIGNALIHVYLTYVNFVFYVKKTSLIAITTFLALAINIIANYALIPYYGIRGAAIATVIAYLFLCVFHFLTAKHFAKQVNRDSLSLKLLGWFFIALMGVYFVILALNQLPHVYAFVTKIALASIIFWIIFKNKIYMGLILR